ncbi:MAG: response regulator transcription factor [Anaerovoracaceae bacterium]|nr:response regulator transcription factor [Anaerovoracaceae bacterium]
MIYLLEDDNNIRNFVTYALNNSGLDAEGFAAPREFWAAMEKQKPQLVMLDIMLPEEDGLSILARLRKAPATKNLPIMMLTAKSTEYDKVVGLDGGADDYVTKPFGTMELIARVKALLRRAEPVSDTRVYEAGGLFLSPAKHIVRVNGEDVALTLKEFELLSYLFKNRGNVLTRDQILQEIWGYEFDGENRTVDVHIRTLRSKLGSCGELIETVRGVGYRISAE